MSNEDSQLPWRCGLHGQPRLISMSMSPWLWWKWPTMLGNRRMHYTDSQLSSTRIPVPILAGRFSVNVTLGSVDMEQLVKILTSVQCCRVSVVRMSFVKIRTEVICATVNKAFWELLLIAEVGDSRSRMILHARRLLTLLCRHFIKITI